MCLPSPTLPTNSPVKPSRDNEHIRNNRRTVRRDVFCVVGVVSNPQYVVKGKQKFVEFIVIKMNYLKYLLRQCISLQSTPLTTTKMCSPLEAGRRAWSLDVGGAVQCRQGGEVCSRLEPPPLMFILSNGPTSFLHRVYIHSVAIVLPKFHVNRAESRSGCSNTKNRTFCFIYYENESA